jgi:hypothetical protein
MNAGCEIRHRLLFVCLGYLIPPNSAKVCGDSVN